jgi:ribosomal protein S27E
MAKSKNFILDIGIVNSNSNKKTVTFAPSVENSLITYHCDRCHSDVSFYSSSMDINCHVCHAVLSSSSSQVVDEISTDYLDFSQSLSNLSSSYPNLQQNFGNFSQKYQTTVLHISPTNLVTNNIQYSRYDNRVNYLTSSPYRKPLSPSSYEYLKNRYYNQLNSYSI